MNVLKHMEAVFVIALSTAAATSFAFDGMTPAAARIPVLAMNTSVPANLAVVHVSAKRLSAAEKRASLDAERTASRAAGRNFGRA